MQLACSAATIITYMYHHVLCTPYSILHTSVPLAPIYIYMTTPESTQNTPDWVSNHPIELFPDSHLGPYAHMSSNLVHLHVTIWLPLHGQVHPVSRLGYRDTIPNLIHSCTFTSFANSATIYECSNSIYQG